ncbi:DUF805 domain-containing protein [Vibrio navarrensis]|uniref:DUF805 domain-containing protein n=1 Tax=Vibrio navarrensis TaxID=29495 RepID=UPI0018DE60C4|nr:DUF805 domain-containing protein [Vibrio navarrensis]MBH9738811.1 hypothetical protein [Vibrio navarrensis]
MRCYILAWQKYADFTGRTSREEFWMFMLFHLLLTLLCIGLDIAWQNASVFDLLYSAVTLLPLLAITVRRLHDIERSGWWCLVFLLPIFGPLLLLYWLTLKGPVATERSAG